MRLIITILFFFFGLFAYAQSVSAVKETEEMKLTKTVKEFHIALVNKNTVSINQQTDKALSYGHSNGLVETKTDLIKNLETGYIVYSHYKEDSITVVINESMASVRYVADLEAALNGNNNKFHLRVLEVWVKKGKRWLLFARQAMK